MSLSASCESVSQKRTLSNLLGELTAGPSERYLFESEIKLHFQNESQLVQSSLPVYVIMSIV